MAKTSPAQFVREVRQEVSKIAWSTRKETIMTTIMVLIMTVIAALFFLFSDIIMSKGINLFLSLGA